MFNTDSEFGSDHPVKEPFEAPVYHPTRFEFLYTHILGALLQGTSPQKHDKLPQRAYELAVLANTELQGRRHDVD